ncbi:MAG TPA: DUF4156 domain-containing protein [Arenimonas sp.]|jgi:hypothetical protein|nr:DUF4156 domain-containing protein [Arenimonas sp.]
MRQLLLCAVVVASLGGCTFVKMAEGAKQVRVAAATEALTACEKRGEVSVSVKDSLGPYERNDLRVRDELETLARNEAPSLQADTVQPKGEPSGGEQRFLAYRCGAGATVGRAPVAKPADEGTAETYPIEE